MSLNRKHVVLFPPVDSVLNVRLDDIVDPISNVLHLSLAFDCDNLDSQSFECLCVLFQFGIIGFSLSLERLFFLSDHFFEFWDFRILLFFCWLIVLLPRLNRLLTSLFFLFFLLDSSLLFYLLVLQFNSSAVENPFQPFLLVTRQHQDCFGQSSRLSQ